MAEVYNYINETGVVVVDTEVINNQVKDEYRQLFGQDLSTDPNTPQGLLITAETIARTAVAENNAAVSNQINPNYAGGIFLDAIYAFTGGERKKATPSTVTAQLTGVEGTIVPAGSLASDTVNNNLFKTKTVVTLGPGVTNVEMESVLNGPIPAEPGTLTQIRSNILGWLTINNSNSAVLGSETASDEEAKNERRATLFLQGASTIGAIISIVNSLPGTKPCFARENTLSIPQVIDGVTMNPHSIYVCVYGGDDLEIAEAIQSKKPGGTSYTNGASSSPVSVPVTVPESGQIIDVLFDRPDIIEISVQVAITVSGAISDPVESVKDSILAYADGLIAGQPGLTVGASVSPWELGGAIVSQNPAIFVKDLQIRNDTAGGVFQYEEILILGYEKARILRGSINVVLV
jgi:uncharacterized phage protein gp47/JayE